MTDGGNHMTEFNGLGMHMGNLARLASGQSRSISAENPHGERGAGGLATEGLGAHHGRELGQGWKIAPAVKIGAGQTFTAAEIEGPGAVQQIWMTTTAKWRSLILRIFWDGQDNPSVECPIGDFFASVWDKFRPISSLAVCVNPGKGFNCYWEMPFRKSCRLTIENLGETEEVLFYQINYTLTAVADDLAYFHARFNRVNPLPYKQVYTILDRVEGRGQYVGTFMAWGVNNSGWWGEGEIKFFLDGEKSPTICGTGTEDYFGGAWNFENQETHRYQEFTNPYSGMAVYLPDGLYQSQTRFSLYRWHIADPIRFSYSLRVTIQALGWRSGQRYLPLQDDIASVAFWYQTLPTAEFPPLPERDFLEIV